MSGEKRNQSRIRVRRRRLKKEPIESDSVGNECAECFEEDSRHVSVGALSNETCAVVKELRESLDSVREELSLLREQVRKTTNDAGGQRTSVASACENSERRRSETSPAGLRRLLRRVVSPRRNPEPRPLRRSPLYHSALQNSPQRSTLFDERFASQNSTPFHSPRFSSGTTASDIESETSESGALSRSRSPRFCIEADDFDAHAVQKDCAPIVAAKDVQIGSLIGNGALARVYAATTFGVGVAVKVYCQSFGPGSESACRDLWRKLEAIRSLESHPHIVRVFGTRLEGENLVSTMERMDCTLQDLIDERRLAYRSIMQNCNCVQDDASAKDRLAELCFCSAPFNAFEIFGILRQCASALSFLHSLPQPILVRGTGERVVAVWHRDLKAENICARRTFGSLKDLLHDLNSDSNDLAQKNVSGNRIDQFYTFALADWDEAHIVYGDESSSDAENCGGKWENTSVLPRAASSPRRFAYSRRRLRDSPQMRERLSLDVGTALFMAPEMMDQSTDIYDEKVDIWSLGMVLYQLLTLELPYALDADVDNFSLSDRVERGVRPTLPHKNSYLSDLDDCGGDSIDVRRTKTAWRVILQLYERCTAFEPSARPSAEDILQRIESVLQVL